MANFDNLLGKLYEQQISQQLGAEVKAPKERVENEEKNHQFGNDYGKGCMEVRAWRRPPEYPEWHISVIFGDSGYECDPGIFMQTDKQKVLELLEDHQRQLTLAIQYIKDNFND